MWLVTPFKTSASTTLLEDIGRTVHLYHISLIRCTQTGASLWAPKDITLWDAFKGGRRGEGGRRGREGGEGREEGEGGRRGREEGEGGRREEEEGEGGRRGEEEEEGEGGSSECCGNIHIHRVLPQRQLYAHRPPRPWHLGMHFCVPTLC